MLVLIAVDFTCEELRVRSKINVYLITFRQNENPPIWIHMHVHTHTHTYIYIYIYIYMEAYYFLQESQKERAGKGYVSLEIS
jgi:hypothetical protein